MAIISQSLLFASTKPPMAVFDDAGDMVSGTVSETAITESLDYNDKTRKARDEDGNILHTLVLTLATDEGDVRVYVPQGSQLASEFGRWLAKRGETEVKTGDAVTVEFLKRRGQAKIYSVR
jgi:hypothetical protein